MLLWFLLGLIGAALFISSKDTNESDVIQVDVQTLAIAGILFLSGGISLLVLGIRWVIRYHNVILFSVDKTKMVENASNLKQNVTNKVAEVKKEMDKKTTAL